MRKNRRKRFKKSIKNKTTGMVAIVLMAGLLFQTGIQASAIPDTALHETQEETVSDVSEDTGETGTAQLTEGNNEPEDSKKHSTEQNSSAGQVEVRVEVQDGTDESPASEAETGAGQMEGQEAQPENETNQNDGVNTEKKTENRQPAEEQNPDQMIQEQPDHGQDREQGLPDDLTDNANDEGVDISSMDMPDQNEYRAAAGETVNELPVEAGGTQGFQCYLNLYLYTQKEAYLSAYVEYLGRKKSVCEKLYESGEITYVEVLDCAAQLAACRAEQAFAGNEAEYCRLYLEELHLDYGDYKVEEERTIHDRSYYEKLYAGAGVLQIARYMTDFQNAKVLIAAKDTEIAALSQTVKMKKLLYESGEITELERMEAEVSLKKAEYERVQYYVNLNIAYDILENGKGMTD